MGEKRPYHKRKTKKTVILSTKITEESKQKLEELAETFDESQAEALADIIDFAYSHFLGKAQLANFASLVV